MVIIKALRICLISKNMLSWIATILSLTEEKVTQKLIFLISVSQDLPGSKSVQWKFPDFKSCAILNSMRESRTICSIKPGLWLFPLPRTPALYMSPTCLSFSGKSFLLLYWCQVFMFLIPQGKGHDAGNLNEGNRSHVSLSKR